MAKLLLIYDPDDRVMLSIEDRRHMPTLKTAELSLADDLEGKDIYEIARKLSELLLEQIEG